MVYNGKPYKKWMIWGENPPFKETSILFLGCVYLGRSKGQMKQVDKNSPSPEAPSSRWFRQEIQEDRDLEVAMAKK